MGIGERLYGVHLDAPQLGIIVEELHILENVGFGQYKYGNTWQAVYKNKLVLFARFLHTHTKCIRMRAHTQHSRTRTELGSGG
jgi:hypothetical protein